MVKVSVPSLTIPFGLVTVALRGTFWSAVLKTAVALEAVVVVVDVPMEKIPSTESVGALVGAGESVSSSRLSSKMAVVVVWMLCNRLMTDVPSDAFAIHGE